MAVRDGEDRDRERSWTDAEPEREQRCPGWAVDLVGEQELIGDAPRVLLTEVGDIEVWGMLAPWEAEELVDGMDCRPTASVAEECADA